MNSGNIICPNCKQPCQLDAVDKSDCCGTRVTAASQFPAEFPAEGDNFKTICHLKLPLHVVLRRLSGKPDSFEHIWGRE